MGIYLVSPAKSRIWQLLPHPFPCFFPPLSPNLLLGKLEKELDRFRKQKFKPHNHDPIAMQKAMRDAQPLSLHRGPDKALYLARTNKMLIAASLSKNSIVPPGDTHTAGPALSCAPSAVDDQVLRTPRNSGAEMTALRQRQVRAETERSSPAFTSQHARVASPPSAPPLPGLPLSFSYSGSSPAPSGGN